MNRQAFYDETKLIKNEISSFFNEFICDEELKSIILIANA